MYIIRVSHNATDYLLPFRSNSLFSVLRKAGNTIAAARGVADRKERVTLKLTSVNLL
jgi:hypothetical protein